MDILIVEDNLVNQKLLTHAVRKMGHQTATANNGRQAVDMVEARPFDLILMDIHMPEMDGLEATARIREREKGTGRRVPIIAVTASLPSEEEGRCLAAGMDAYVAKPYTRAAIQAALEKVLAANERARGQ